MEKKIWGGKKKENNGLDHYRRERDRRGEGAEMAPGDGREVSADVESLVGGWGEREMRGREEKGEKKGGESDRH